MKRRLLHDGPGKAVRKTREASKKPPIFEALFKERWNESTKTLSRALVSLKEVSAAIRKANEDSRGKKALSDRNPANFLKDFIRSPKANDLWPATIRNAGFTVVQRTTEGACFEFVALPDSLSEPFSSVIPELSPSTHRHKVETLSMPLASRRLGRGDEPWLAQVAVRLRLLETHFALSSARNIVQMDHLQMSVKLRGSEIDALFLAIEELSDGTHEELIVSCEAKGVRERISDNQIVRQVKAVFKIRGVTQSRAIPVAVKAIGPSLIQIVEFDVVDRSSVDALTSLRVASNGLYELQPPMPGIGS